MLFGKDFTDYPQCRLRLARFKGTTKRDFIDNQQEEGNIFQLVDAADAMMRNEEIEMENTSLPPNPVIANVMYQGGLIEHWGRGLSMMAREC